MKRTPRWILLTLLAKVALLIGVLFLAQSAFATTFVLMDEEDLAESAEAALIGLVTSVDPVVDADDGSIQTYVSIVPDAILFGDLPPDEVVLRERGGEVSGRRERVFGVPRYAVGERVLVFVTPAADGARHTTAMAMGKYRLSAGDDGAVVAARSFDEGSVVLDPQSGGLATAPQRTDLSDLLARIAEVRSIRMPPRIDPTADTIEESESFTYLGKPSRWFEPDQGSPVEFLVCPPEGHPELSAQAKQAVAEALDAWSFDPLSSLVLVDGTLDEPMSFNSCSGPNRVIFDDPFDEVDDPYDCTGVVAIGGYCVLGSETRSLDGQTFRRIQVGRVTFADGWSGCAFWNPCNMAEVATHEVGHAIGLGHSTSKGATMEPVAQFDGRCGGLAKDDLAGLRALYPLGVVFSSPTPTRTNTQRPTPTERTTSIATPSITKRPTRTPRFQSTSPTPTPKLGEPTVGIAETPPPTMTPAENGICEGDANSDHQVTIDEVIAVLANSLHGCAPD
jgi:hypothetical protein